MRSPTPIWAVAALLLAGCPGSLDDPGRFIRGGGGDGTCPDGFDVEADLFQQTCANITCHTGGDVAAAGLDLRAPNAGARLLAHVSSECDDRPLIDPQDLESSFLFEKVGEEPSCGQRMPLGLAPLSSSERACLMRYVEDLVGVAEPVDGGVQ